MYNIPKEFFWYSKGSFFLLGLHLTVHRVLIAQAKSVGTIEDGRGHGEYYEPYNGSPVLSKAC